MEDEESLVMRRPRRSTAGNRMEAALAEFKAEDLGQDVEEDVDFIVQIDEQDAFESDFESTDEEASQEDVDAAAENMVRDEEKSRKRTARTQLDKVTAAAHVRQKATFNPQVEVIAPPKKLNRRVSLGVVVDAETGIVVQGRKRKSLRRHTMLSTSLTETRAKDEQEKKSALPRRTKVKIKPPTQEELIARALAMEAGNIKEHRGYLQMEEEKRKRARVVRTAVEGPLLRWVSKSEEVTVLVQPPPQPQLQPMPAPQFSPQYPYYPPMHPATPPSPISQSPYFQHPPPPYYPSSPQVSSPQMTFVYHSFSQAGPAMPAPPSLQPLPRIPASAPLPPPPIEKVETVAKNYVVHEMAQKEGTGKPLWKETMTAMFGDHVRWDELKVYTGKGRPLTRPKDICPITGQVARYRDPRTGVPYADVPAFQTLTRVLSHDFVWSEGLGCYVSARTDAKAADAGSSASTSDAKGKKRAR